MFDSIQHMSSSNIILRCFFFLGKKRRWEFSIIASGIQHASYDVVKHKNKAIKGLTYNQHSAADDASHCRIKHTLSLAA